MDLEQLGPRICIMGPSGSGKSSLATAIGAARGLPVVHLDQLRHRPQTDWQLRPEPEFVALHEAAIREDAWVMDGNYSLCLPSRLARATGVIVLDVSSWTSLARYWRRTRQPQGRLGGLDGGCDRLKWSMIWHILYRTPANRRRYRQWLSQLELPGLGLLDVGAIDAFYRQAGLSRLDQ